MSEWYENQKKPSSNIRKLLQERTEKANPRRKLSAEENKRLRKLEGIADNLSQKGRARYNVILRTALSYIVCNFVRCK